MLILPDKQLQTTQVGSSRLTLGVHHIYMWEKRFSETQGFSSLPAPQGGPCSGVHWTLWGLQVLHRTLGTAPVPCSHCGIPPLWGREHPRSLGAAGGKGQKLEGPQKNQSFISKSHTCHGIAVLTPDLLYEPMTVVCKGVGGKGREKGRDELKRGREQSISQSEFLVPAR